jgi:tetraacyldisaccharide 4'-kinase
MSGLGSLFGVGVRMRNALYDAGTLRARHLQGPVISIGNISVGGAGKTPFTILLGELLKARGIKFDVLSRGYHRESRGVVMVDRAGTAAQFGDEPLLIAQHLRVPVIVGESRHEAGLFAERKFGPQLHLLDDGFQHRRLARDFDIVLVTPEDIADQLLPEGRLREPLTSLRRADAIVLMRAAVPDRLPVPPNKTIWRTKRSAVVPDAPPHPLAFCAIARPQAFFAELREAGVELAATRQFRDHHRYTEADIRAIVARARRTKAGGFVTTEKDAMNLGSLAESLAPLAVAKVALELEDADAALDLMLAKIEQRRTRMRELPASYRHMDQMRKRENRDSHTHES